MKNFNIFNFQEVSESREVARGPKYPPPPGTNRVKSRFLGTSGTDTNCYCDICVGNICPGDICPYQEYLSCY